MNREEVDHENLTSKSSEIKIVRVHLRDDAVHILSSTLFSSWLAAHLVRVTRAPPSGPGVFDATMLFSSWLAAHLVRVTRAPPSGPGVFDALLLFSSWLVVHFVQATRALRSVTCGSCHSSFERLSDSYVIHTRFRIAESIGNF